MEADAMTRAARGARDARLTPVQWRGVLGVVDAVLAQHPGSQPLAHLRRELLEAQRDTAAAG